MAVERRYTNFTIYRRVYREARPYWLHIFGLLLISLLSTPFALLTPLPLKIAVDSVLGDEPLPGFLQAILPAAAMRSSDALLVVVVVLFIAIALLTNLRGLCSQILKTYTGQKLVLYFRSRLLSQAQRLSLSYHDAKGTSDSLYRIQYDASAVRSIATNGVIPFVSSTFKLVIMIYVISRISMQLALVAVVITPVLFLTLRLYTGHLQSGWRGVKKLDSAVMSIVQEVLGGIRVVKAFGQEERERRRYVGHGEEKVRARTRLAVSENGLSLIIGMIVAAGSATVLFIGIGQVQAGSLTLGSLLLVMSYLSQLYRPLEKMSENIGEMQSALVSAERAFTLLDQAPDVVERPNAVPLRRAGGAVTFDRVSFAYDDENLVLRDISFEVSPGTRLGIAGTTGAGKTTLVSLLTRFYDPTSGRILLDGIDLRDYKLTDLRNQFAIVLQEPMLFSTSIAENIAYARPGAQHEQVVAAARAANAHNFIIELPKGYETVVGERGMRLSGGERQRISLARAFLKDAPILILDEPTSSVDMKTEAAIMEAMEALMRGRTTFMIAHRLSTLDGCDARLEIEHGRILELTKGVA